MKRMISIFLTGLMLLSAACAAAPKPEAEAPEPETSEEPEPETTEAPKPKPIGNADPVDPVIDPLDEIPEVNGYDGFTSLLSAALLDGTKNRNLSPISVYLALAMVAEGANGETQAELLKLLGCKSLSELRSVCAGMLETLSVDAEDATVDFHNSLWMADEIDGEPVTFHASYLETLADTFRSEAYVVDFRGRSACEQIAAWINKYTRGKIEVQPDALDFDPMTIAVLINTIYLKANWSDAFGEEETEAGTFYGLDGAFDVNYMWRFDKNRTVRVGEGFTAYGVTLNRVGRVTFILPDEGVALDSLLGSADAIDTLLHSGEYGSYDVDLLIPKFKFQDKMDLTGVLSALGLRLSFSRIADFSGMTDTPCCIDSVIQESYIGVDENGVEAAAYTMISMRATGMMPQEEVPRIDFHLTRPFAYAIESYDGTVLFIGTVTNPTPAA